MPACRVFVERHHAEESLRPTRVLFYGETPHGFHKAVENRCWVLTDTNLMRGSEKTRHGSTISAFYIRHRTTFNALRTWTCWTCCWSRVTFYRSQRSAALVVLPSESSRALFRAAACAADFTIVSESDSDGQSPFGIAVARNPLSSSLLIALIELLSSAIRRRVRRLGDAGRDTVTGSRLSWRNIAMSLIEDRTGF